MTSKEAFGPTTRKFSQINKHTNSITRTKDSTEANEKEEMVCFHLFFTVVARYSTAFAQAQDQVAVTTISGAVVTGLAFDNVDAFLGIQYAQVRERFSRSSLLEPANMVNASAFGPNCHQTYIGLPDFIYQSREEKEECLFLNIWRPSKSTVQPLSTMVYIHGGGFAIGSGADEVNNGVNFARNQNVMVVSINYRLGVLGFLPKDDSGTGGMNGLHDQIMALEWIQQNIAAFGGNPESVTVFGESSGGEAICMMLVSPLARGLFQRAILQSGECINNAWGGGIPNDNIESGRTLVDTLLTATGASSITDLKNATRFPPTELTSESLSVGWPVVFLDKEVLPQHPRELYTPLSNLNPSEIIVGSNSYEDALVMGLPPQEYIAMAGDIENWATQLIGTIYGNEAAANTIEVYSPSEFYDGDAISALAQLNGDYYIRCPVREFASIASTVASGNVYIYNFAHFSNIDPVIHFGLSDFTDIPSDWASHLAENPFIFGTFTSWLPQDKNLTISDRDYALSAEIQARWANFAKNGDPNVPGLNEWKAVEPDLRSGESATAISAFVFRSNGSEMEIMPGKVQQCSSFPFTLAKSDSNALPSSMPSMNVPSTPTVAPFVEPANTSPSSIPSISTTHESTENPTSGVTKTAPSVPITVLALTVVSLVFTAFD